MDGVIRDLAYQLEMASGVAPLAISVKRILTMLFRFQFLTQRKKKAGDNDGTEQE